VVPPAVDRSATPLLEMRQVTRHFPTQPPTEALRGVDLAVDAGHFLAIVGPSGAGKTTLLNVLALLDRPTSGSYRIEGDEVAEFSEHERTAYRAGRFGFIFQAFHLIAHKTALENVALAGVYTGRPRAERMDAAAEALAIVGLTDRSGAYPPTLSGGEKQRVAIARAICGEPKVLFADEPSGNLDSRASGRVLDALDALHEAGLTIVVVTHDPTVSERAETTIEVFDGVIRPGARL